MSDFFNELLESMQQMDEIIKGERTPSREFHLDALAVKEIHNTIGLSQNKFAEYLGIEVSTLCNWEQGRREPTGPAKVLL